MRLIYIITGLAFMMVMFSSCLKKDLPALPLWNGTAVTNVYFEYRYKDSSNIWEGAPVVAYQALTVNKTVDSAKGIINLDVTVPPAKGTFTAAERANVMQNHLWCYMDVSTSAAVAPVGDAPAPGFFGDFTKPQQFKVTAANGSSQVWTLVITSFNK